jgi:sulfur carrier protein ThiS
MSATIKPIGLLKTYIGGQGEITVRAGQTVLAALDALGVPAQLVALVIVNDAPQPKDYWLQEGDVVRLLAVIGGGSGIGSLRTSIVKR